MEKDVLILAIESSCDETAASVVKNGRTVLSNVISSQIALHTLYGGVVPEIASRKHIEKINQVIEEALAEAQVTLDDLDAIGVTYGPGLVGALLVGVAEARQSAMPKNFRWLAYTILRDIFVPIILKTKNWSRRLSVWWFPEAIHIWSWWRITGNIKFSDEPGMMRPEKRLTRWQEPLASDIRAALR